MTDTRNLKKHGLMTFSQAMSEFGFSLSDLVQLVNDGKLGKRNFGTSKYLVRAQIEKLVEQRINQIKGVSHD